MTSPPASAIARIASRLERPVVTTSSTSRTLGAGIEAEAAAQFEGAGRALDEHRGQAEGAAHFVADDDPAHRRGDHRLQSAAEGGVDLVGERAGETLGARRVHQHPRALQVARRAEARGEDEVAFEQRFGSPEFGQNILFGHASRPSRHRLCTSFSLANYKGRDKRLRRREPLPIRPRLSGGPAGPILWLEPVTGVVMTFKFGLIALAAVGMTPVAAQGQTPANPAPQEQAAATTAAPAGPSAAAANPSATPAAATDATGASAVAPGAAPTAPAFDHAVPTPGIGMPDGRIGLQDQFTPVGREASAFHDNWLLALCAAMSLLVLVLLMWTMVKYRRSNHPTPSRTSHNTVVEVIWTLVPVLVLVAIAVPSIRLIRHQYSPPPADLTIKVIGNQWYWSYQYPDNGGFEIVSNMLKEKADAPAGTRFRTDADGPRLLGVDERMVIPAGKVVKFIVTSNDVIHSFAMPAFWTKTDANPGILNETWVKVDRPGVYFGQCSELCGARHAFMPIAIEVVTPERFAQWVAAKGGTMPGAGRPAGGPGATPAVAPADSTAATQVSPAAVTAPAPAAGAAPVPAPAGGAAPAAPGNTQPNVANRATTGTN